MKKLIVLLMLTFSAAIVKAQTTWNIVKDISFIGFGVDHFTVCQAIGCFREFDAKVVSRSQDLAGAEVTFTAKTASIWTGNEVRDHHVKSDDFLNAAQYPEITFTGNLLKNGQAYELKGNLTIRNVTRPVSFPVKYTGHIRDTALPTEKIGFTVSGKINRLEYGLKWNEHFQGGDPIIGEQVDLILHIEIEPAPL